MKVYSGREVRWASGTAKEGRRVVEEEVRRMDEEGPPGGM